MRIIERLSAAELLSALQHSPAGVLHAYTSQTSQRLRYINTQGIVSHHRRSSSMSIRIP